MNAAQSNETVNLWTRLQRPLNLRAVDGLWVLIPALLWGGAVQLRPIFLKPDCMTQECNVARVPWIDRPSLGNVSPEADALSTHIQNYAGAATVMIPTAWNFAQIALSRATPASALVATFADLSLLVQTVSWNGVLTETARLFSNRARPFVYTDPAREGRELQHYTSFYSGHVSFTAASLTGLLLVLFGRGFPAPGLVFVALASQAAVITGAYGRILSGRHFLTDTLVGATMGVLVAFCVAVWVRQRASERTNR